MKKYIIIIIVFASMAAGFMLRGCINSNEIDNKLPLIPDSFKHDTIIKTVQSEPIILYKVKTKVKKLNDSTINTFPFSARLDTIIKSDTIKAEYRFPQNTMSLELYQKPDTLRTEKITLFKTIEKEREWWESPAYIIGGVLAGFIIRSAIK